MPNLFEPTEEHTPRSWHSGQEHTETIDDDTPEIDIVFLQKRLQELNDVVFSVPAQKALRLSREGNFLIAHDLAHVDGNHAEERPILGATDEPPHYAIPFEPNTPIKLGRHDNPYNMEILDNLYVSRHHIVIVPLEVSCHSLQLHITDKSTRNPIVVKPIESSIAYARPAA